MAKSSQKRVSARCNCNTSNLCWLVLGVVTWALGFFGLVQGFLIQWNGGDWVLSVLWYAGGILVMMIGKMWKKKACGSCPCHGHCY